ncbi:MAG: hypothetical protein P8X79_21670 [Reinekea sp.]
MESRIQGSVTGTIRHRDKVFRGIACHIRHKGLDRLLYRTVCPCGKRISLSHWLSHSLSE